MLLIDQSVVFYPWNHKKCMCFDYIFVGKVKEKKGMDGNGREEM